MKTQTRKPRVDVVEGLEFIARHTMLASAVYEGPRPE